MDIKKKIKLTCRLCDVFSIIPLGISLIYTLKFFVTGASDLLNIVLMIMLSITLESVKIILTISTDKNKVKKMFMYLFIIVSISFTMNDFLNVMEKDKQASKQINPEYTKNQVLIEKSNKIIENFEKEIDVLNSQKENELKNLVPENFKITKTSTAKHYDERKESISKNYNEKLDKVKQELKEEQLKNENIINKKIEKFVYKNGSAGAINTKILDFLLGDKVKQESKSLIIALFIAIVIDLTHLVLTYVKSKELKKLELIEIEEKRIEEIKRKEAKKKEILNSEKVVIKSITPATEVENNSNRKIIDLVKKPKVQEYKNLTELANKILERTIENNGIVEKYRDLQDEFDVSYSVIQRRIKELIDNGIVEKVPNSRMLRLVNIEKLKETN